MRRDEFGFGNQDRLEVWRLKGKVAERSIVWIPYDDAQAGARDVMWGEFLDSTHLATSSRAGKVVIWSFPELEPLTTFTLVDGAVPSLGPDRKQIAYCNGKEVGIYDVVRGEVIAQQATPQELQWPYLAFSPSGKRLGCVAFDKVLVWDVATGKLERTIPGAGIHVHGAIDYPDDGFILAGGKFLIDLENQLKLWTYDGQEKVVSVAGWTFFAVTAGEQQPGALVAAQIPQPAARDLLKKALSDPNLFVLRAGATVRLNLNGIPDAGQKEHVRKALTDRLQTIGCLAGDGGTIELAASMEGPKDRKISFFGSGDYTVKEYIGRARFVYQGETAWETTGTNVPFFVSLKQGENIGDHLRQREKPDYAFFDRVELPRFLQKPTKGQGAGNSLTLGKSNVTTAGLGSR
jgi:WD40 repeat protein